MTGFTRILGFLGVVLAASACQTPGAGPEPALSGVDPGCARVLELAVVRGGAGDVVVDSRRPHGRLPGGGVIALQDTRAQNTASGFEVSAAVQNCSDMPIEVEARTHFIGNDRSPTQQPSEWRRITVPSMERLGYNEVSDGASPVAQYSIELRAPQEQLAVGDESIRADEL